MADEDNGLHEPWAPPRDDPAEGVAPPPVIVPAPVGESDVPTRAVPLDPAPEMVVTPLLVTHEPGEPVDPLDSAATAEAAGAEVEPATEPTAEADEVVPPPTTPGGKEKRRWPGSAKAVTIVLAVALVAAAAGLGYGWWKTNEDKKDLETASNQQGQELSQQLDKANSSLATSQSDLDAANKQVADLQGQLKKAQDDAATAQAEAAAVTKLFPVNATTVAAGVPGNYRTSPLSPQAGSCTLASCPSTQLTLAVASNGGGLTVSDPGLGQVALQSAGAGWSATGATTSALQLQCQGVALPTTFTLAMSPAAVALDSKGSPQVTTMAGSLLLTAAAVPAVAEPPSTGCPAGVSSYVFSANRT
jgi:hypothetical protein